MVIGNGPSLNSTPLKRLSEKYPTLGSNKIYELPFTPTYYCVIDEFMMRAICPLPGDFTPKAKFIRAEANEPDNNPIYPIVVNGFSPDISNFVVMGGTVTYALLQIAFFMAFKTVLLVGVDHHYPKTGNLAGGSPFVAGGKDPDHFTPASGKPYFEEGKRYAAPETKNTTAYYGFANAVYEREEARIINLTPGTHLDVFEKQDFAKWI